MAVKSSKLEVKKTTAKAATARLFFLSASSGEVFSANPDGSDLKIIVSEGRRIPDGIVVDVEAGHLYWTNMGNPTANDGSIERANLDGSNVTHIVPTGGTFTPKNCNLMRKTGSFTGRIARACGSCVATWMVPRSNRLSIPAQATHVRVKKLRSGAWALRSTSKPAKFIGLRRVRPMPVRDASFAPISRFRRARLQRTAKMSNSCTRICLNLSTSN